MRLRFPYVVPSFWFYKIASFVEFKKLYQMVRKRNGVNFVLKNLKYVIVI
jgi:hypothetical protein